MRGLGMEVGIPAGMATQSGGHGLTDGFIPPCNQHHEELMHALMCMASSANFGMP